jgi:hypothetical protein
MSLPELFTKIRNINVRALSKVARQHSPCHIEPVLRNKDGSLAIEGSNGLSVRYDIIIAQDPDETDSVRVAPTKLQFEPVYGLCNGIPVTVSSFGWDYADLSATFDKSPNLEPLIRWFFSWFDQDDENKESPEGLFGVVHFLSDPEYNDGRLTFIVDFGSAPIAALESLLVTLIDMCATEVAVG